MRKVACYIDGFNLYHGIDDLHLPHLKWVNLWKLCDSFVRNQEELTSVNYFSAFAKWKRHQYARHMAYVKALEAAGVNCVLAHFKQKDVSCKTCGSTWTAHEEKETDVRIALKILEDAEDHSFDRAIIISGDSDLVPVVQSLKRRHPDKSVLIATPPGRYRTSRDLRGASGGQGIEIRKGRIEGNLFPANVQNDAGETVATRPSQYTPPEQQ